MYVPAQLAGHTVEPLSFSLTFPKGPCSFAVRLLRIEPEDNPFASVSPNPF